MKPLISVIIPNFNSAKTLLKTLTSLSSQTFTNFEVILVDDCSTDDSWILAKGHKIQNMVILRNSKNLGPAMTRNKGISEARADIIAFTDSDVIVTKNWLEKIHEGFKDVNNLVLMGNTKIPKSTTLGDAISAQGFPGGGSVGFDKMWHVSKEGHTDHITSCNFAARKEVFRKYGGFDESFPLPGGEDPELSYRLTRRGLKIKYNPGIVVYHEPRNSFRSWIRWQIQRGRSNYHFKRKVGKVGGFLKLRIWSSWNIIKMFFFRLKFPLVLILLLLSFILQQYGYMFEKRKDRK